MVNKPLMRRRHILLRSSNTKLTINIDDRTVARRANRRQSVEQTIGINTTGTCRALALAGTCLATLASGAAGVADTVTPVMDLIVVFQENVPFDHYFATDPGAAPLAAGEAHRPRRARGSTALRHRAVRDQP